MTRVSYYPGCSLEASAREFDTSIRATCRLLSIDLSELEDWSCCGATAAHSLNKYLAIALPARNLVMAEKQGYDLVVPCASCYNRLKTAEKALLKGEYKEFSYQGRIKIWDFLTFMAQKENMDKIKSRIKKPLKGLKVVCYYGCLVARPPKITDTKNYEDPKDMDELVSTLGAEVYPWSYKTDCCSGSLGVVRPEIMKTAVQRLYDLALEAGAECFVTACQMCFLNLDVRQKEISAKAGKTYYLPVFYFTELIALALGYPGVYRWFKKHMVSPNALLQNKGLL